MQLKLHQPIEGRAAGEVVDVPQGRANFYIGLGYAVKADGNDDGFNGSLETGPDAKHDPTLAENREKPDEDVPTTDDPTVVQRDDLGATQDFSGGVYHEYNPGDHSVAEVNKHLAEHPGDAGRILELERGGKARKGILESGADFGPQAIETVPQHGTVRDLPIEPSADTLAAANSAEPVPDPPLDDEQPGDPHHDEPDND